MIFWTALMLGLGGSLHCVGMCGPIALALPLTQKEKTSVFLQSLWYNLGRISTYGLMGFCFGWLGWGIALAGYQNIFSIFLGVLLLLIGLTSISIENKLLQFPAFQFYFNQIKRRLSQALAIRGKASAFRIGLLNGWLPCGLVYVALAGSIATNHPLLGGMYMMLFGLGTLPLMLGVMVLGKGSWKKHLQKLYKLIPFALSLLGVYLIYRGMILEIPRELSFWESGNFPIMCH